MTKRIYLIDELRGLAIVFMIIFHIIYQRVVWFSLPSEVLSYPLVRLCQLGAQILFISISGVSCAFSKNNLRRGSLCLFYGLLITIATYFIAPSEIIVFGILHFLGCAIIIYGLFGKLLSRIKPIMGAIFSSLCFISFYPLIYNNILLESIKNISFFNYLWKKGVFNLLGIPSPQFYSSDYFPFVPWFFLFLTGVFIGTSLINSPPTIHKPRIKMHSLIFLGRHSLIIYLLHIPIILAALFSFEFLISIS